MRAARSRARRTTTSVSPISNTIKPVDRSRGPAHETVAMGERITCPFCGLSCDDLLVSEAGVDTRGCALAAAGFARAALSRKPHTVAGKPASLQTAVIAAAALLRGTTRP